MAYSDYSGEVLLNGKRMENYEDTEIYEGSEAWKKAYEQDSEKVVFTNIFHGVMGDENIRVACFKERPPYIFELADGKIRKVDYIAMGGFRVDGKDFDIIFEYHGYKFRFMGDSWEKANAYMKCTDGSRWECEYGYDFD